MVSIVTKRIKGHEYLYLVDSVRKGKRVIQKSVKYIGKKRPILEEEFECMKRSYKNEDWILNEFIDELSYQDHEIMKQCSDNYKQHLKSLDSVSKQKEKEKFLSVFIANSNAIEGSTLTVKETYNYLFKDSSPAGHSKKELYMAANMLKAWEYVERHCSNFPQHMDLFLLHQLVNTGIEDHNTLGSYKRVQNYIGDIHTTSYLFVTEKMEQLFAWIKKGFKKMSDFEVAFQSHAQFEIIHPFVDGNGRVGRLLLNWLLMHRKKSPLAIHDSQRAKYLNALENSRKGKVAAISTFCFEQYKKTYRFVDVDSESVC